jgi:hypothetical protein
MSIKDIVRRGESNVWKASCVGSRAVSSGAWGHRFGRAGRYFHVAHRGGPNFFEPELKTRVEARTMHADIQA